MHKGVLSRTNVMHIGFIFMGSLLGGAVFQLILNTGGFWQGFIAATALFFLSGTAMYLLWRRAGAQRALGWMMLTAFFVRIVLGVFLTWGLPRFGYDEPTQRAGFVFFDAFRRESQAWTLSQSGDPLLRAFSDEFGTDQYGGMLTLSAAIYRYLSSDAFRPGLVLIVVAGAFSLSIPFLVALLRRWFDMRIGIIAGWILALYPEGVLLGASQMREAFIILSICMLLWSAGEWLINEKHHRGYFIGIVGIVVLLVFSYRLAISAIGFTIIWVWFEWTSKKTQQFWRIIRWIVLVFATFILLLGLQGWLVEVAQWDTLQTLRASGRLQFHLADIADWLRSPLIWAYGILQPFLPAAVVHPAPWIWRGIAIFRSFGWYAMLPLLIYGLFRIWMLPSLSKKRFLVIALFFVWVWIGISTIRAGGDQWDNPRYRTIFLPLMSILGGWGLFYAREIKDRWFTRGLLIEGIFLGFFTQWYVSRYYHFFGRFRLEVMIVAIVMLSAIVILVGWNYDRKHQSYKMTDGEELT